MKTNQIMIRQMGEFQLSKEQKTVSLMLRNY